MHERMGDGTILGGERGGKRVEGFHCGNSPPEYTAQVIKGKSLILATTNGTIAMERCRLASLVLIGAFVNMGAIANRILKEPKLTLLCSGTDGHITSEDILFAGALTELMLSLDADLEIKDAAQISLSHWQSTQRKIRNENKHLADFMRTARGGENLVRIGWTKISYSVRKSTRYRSCRCWMLKPGPFESGDKFSLAGRSAAGAIFGLERPCKSLVVSHCRH